MMQRIPSAKVFFYHSTSVGREEEHMDQVPNLTRPTTNFRSSFSISHYSKLLKCGDSKNIPYLPSLGLFNYQSITSFPKILVTVESHSFLCCLCSRLIITNHCGSSDINQLSVCPDSDVDKFKFLLHCSRNVPHETM